MQIRTANVNDADIVTDMVVRLLTELSGEHFEKETYFIACSELLENPHLYTVFLAFNETNHCVGMVSVAESYAIYTAGRFGIIQEFYVSPESRSLKVGHYLLKSVIEHGRKCEWQRIEVGAPDALKWKRTIAFYQKEGFKEIGPRLKLTLK